VPTGLQQIRPRSRRCASGLDHCVLVTFGPCRRRCARSAWEQDVDLRCGRGRSHRRAYARASTGPPCASARRVPPCTRGVGRSVLDSLGGGRSDQTGCPERPVLRARRSASCTPRPAAAVPLGSARSSGRCHLGRGGGTGLGGLGSRPRGRCPRCRGSPPAGRVAVVSLRGPVSQRRLHPRSVVRSRRPASTRRRPFTGRIGARADA
jgi:hypothetical protein